MGSRNGGGDSVKTHRNDDLLTRGELRAVKHFRELRERPQLSLDLPIEPPYDPRRHPYIVTHIARKDGAGFVEDNSGILIYFDVRGDL